MFEEYFFLIDHIMLLCYYAFMRTTMDLPDGLFRKVKAISSLRGVSLKKFITMAIEHEVEANTLNLDTSRISLPIIPSKNPGSVSLSSERIAELLEWEDLHVSS